MIAGPERGGKDTLTLLKSILEKNLTGEQALSALSLWQHDYSSDAPASVLVKYVNNLGRSFQLSSATQRQLRLNLAEGLVLSQLPATGSKPLVGGLTQDSVPTNASRAPTTAVFGALGRHLISAAHYAGPDECHRFINAVTLQLHTSALNPALQTRVLQWCQRPDLPAPHNLDLKQIKIVSNIFYLAAVEACGPAVGDAILHKALKRTRDLPLARQCPPESLF